MEDSILPAVFYDSWEEYDMPKRKYLTEEKFNEWKGNDFKHLEQKVIANTKLLYLILAAVLGAGAIDRIFG